MFINGIQASAHCSIVAILGVNLSLAHNSPFTKIIALSFYSRIWVSNKHPRSLYWPLFICSLFEEEMLTLNVSCTLGFGKTTLPGASKRAELHCGAIWLWLSATLGSTMVAGCAELTGAAAFFVLLSDTFRTFGMMMLVYLENVTGYTKFLTQFRKWLQIIWTNIRYVAKTLKRVFHWEHNDTKIIHLSSEIRKLWWFFYPSKWPYFLFRIELGLSTVIGNDDEIDTNICISFMLQDNPMNFFRARGEWYIPSKSLSMCWKCIKKSN